MELGLQRGSYWRMFCLVRLGMRSRRVGFTKCRTRWTTPVVCSTSAPSRSTRLRKYLVSTTTPTSPRTIRRLRRFSMTYQLMTSVFSRTFNINSNTCFLFSHHSSTILEAEKSNIWFYLSNGNSSFQQKITFKWFWDDIWSLTNLYELILFYDLNNLRQVFCTFHLFIMAIMKDLKKTTVKRYDWVYSYSSPKEEKTAVFCLKAR